MLKNYAIWGHRYHPECTRTGSSRLHYHLLPDKLKGEYDVMVDALTEGEDSVILCGVIDPDSILMLEDAVMYDNPLFCEFDFGKEYEFCEEEMMARLKIRRNYGSKEFDRYIDMIEDRVDWFREKTAGMDDYHKELFVHDSLARTIKYDLTEKDQRNIIGPMIRGKGTCLGISRSTMYILNRLGVDTSTLAGIKTGKTYGHAWNVVNLDGRNYHLDVTFDKVKDGNPVHFYFNVDDTALVGADHIWYENVHCHATEYNYHIINGSFVTDQNKIGETVRRLHRRSNEFELKLSPPLASRMGKDSIIQAVKNAIGFGHRLDWVSIGDSFGYRFTVS